MRVTLSPFGRKAGGIEEENANADDSGLVKGMEQAPNINPADIDVMFSTNVTGLINMTQAVLPIFKARPDGGRGDIINIGSIAGREPYQGGSIYCATKAAVRSFTDAMRRELVSTRIRVIEIDPGQVETEFSIVRFRGDTEKAAKVYEGVEPLTPDDIAEVVVFAAGRRENVVLADTLIFPNHQVRDAPICLCVISFGANVCGRRRRRSCIGSRLSERLVLTCFARLGREAPCTRNRRPNYRVEAGLFTHAIAGIESIHTFSMHHNSGSWDNVYESNMIIVNIGRF